MKVLLVLLFGLFLFDASAQQGLITGTVIDDKIKPLEGASLQLSRLPDTVILAQSRTGKEGGFQFSGLPFGYYRLRISYIGLASLQIDSIYLRPDRYDFNLNDLTLHAAADPGKMDEVIIYAEKSLIQSKDGNITFNAGESALSSGSSAGELLNSVPLVTKDPNGKLLVRGKEPKILIDDKPVELNLQQLQDLLESMPGSSIEKIEVMTNPPPQYANEQGGVINIVTKKGTIGKSGRLALNAGSRGEAGVNASFNYRKQGLALNLVGGMAANVFEGEGYSRRINQYTDSTNYFDTDNNYRNKNLRPNFRAQLNYDINKKQALNVAVQYNGNRADNTNLTRYTNRNRHGEIYRLSEREIGTEATGDNPAINFSYLLRTKKPGESIRITGDLNASNNEITRDFYQQFFFNNGQANGIDSTQEQINENKSAGQSYRLAYELPFSKSRTYLSFGSFYTRNRSDVDVHASYRKKSDGSWASLPSLENSFLYRQQIINGRASIKKVFKDYFSATVGINAERTAIRFDLYQTGDVANNNYWSWLPFASLNRNWKDRLNLTFSYRRTIRRPGIYELNPTVDFSDPYNIRFGNPDLLPSTAHNFDLVLGKTVKSFYANLGLGYNLVQDIYNQVRTLTSNGKTEITWQNISGRKEYELSTWSGYTVTKDLRFNLSASYTYNEYGSFDREVRKYRNGGSLTSNLNTNYIVSDRTTITGSFTFNKFANPQGLVRSSVSMNLGAQTKLMQKRLVLALNLIDPFFQQQNRTFTYGPNFSLESYSSTQTRNIRVSIAYNFSKRPKKASLKLPESLRKSNPPARS